MKEAERMRELRRQFAPDVVAAADSAATAQQEVDTAGIAKARNWFDQTGRAEILTQIENTAKQGQPSLRVEITRVLEGAEPTAEQNMKVMLVRAFLEIEGFGFKLYSDRYAGTTLADTGRAHGFDVNW